MIVPVVRIIFLLLMVIWLVAFVAVLALGAIVTYMVSCMSRRTCNIKKGWVGDNRSHTDPIHTVIHKQKLLDE